MSGRLHSIAVRGRAGCILAGIAAFGLVLTMPALTAPKVVLISLDGATPGNIEEFLEDGTLSKRRGLGLLIKHGVMAERNITITPLAHGSGAHRHCDWFERRAQ